jgi:Cu+-exporting ATPase
MAILVGTGAASRRGMLIKDAATLERAASIDQVVFDKTGTLTTGQPRVTSVEAIPPADRGEVLRLAAAVEAQSEHPIGRAIREAADEAFGALRSPLAAESFVALPGVGVRGVVDGDRIEVLRDAVASCRVLRNGMPIGRVSVADAPRPGAAEAIALLRGRGKRSSAGGVRTIHMLTGDRASGAHAIGAAIGLQESEIVADATPASKAAFVRDLRGRSAGKGGVLLVGDGVNDAAALAEADVGVAMGSGTAIAIEAAPVVLLSEDPRAVPALLAVARASMRCVRQNLFLAFAYNTIAIPAAAFGLLGPRGPLIAAAAMALSNLSVVGNALRLRRQLAAPERP